jgi:hypothetical protein
MKTTKSKQADGTLHYGQDVILFDFEHEDHGIVAGVGYGKTYAGPPWLEIRRRRSPKCDEFLIVAPDYRMLKLRTLYEYEKFLNRCGMREGKDYSYNRSDSFFTFHDTGQRVIGLSAEKPEKISSYNTGAIWRDESALMVEDVKDRCEQRNRNPYAEFPQTLDTTTPEGLNWVYERFNPEKMTRDGVISRGDSKLLLHGRSHDNPYLSERFLKKLEREFAWDPLYYANYVLGEFVSLSRNAFYFSFDQMKHVGNYPLDPEWPHMSLSWDSNVGMMTWVVIQQFGDDFYVCKENGSNGRNVQDACQQFIHAFPPADYAHWNIAVLGDASLWKRSDQTYTNSYQLIEHYLKPHYPLLHIEAHRGNPFVEERSRCTNHLLATDHLKIDRSCRKVIMSAKTAESAGKGKVKKPSGDTVTHPMEAVDMGLIVLAPPEIRFESFGVSF